MLLLTSLRGAFTLMLFVLNTLFWGTPLLSLAVLKLVPVDAWRDLIGRVLIALAENWISTNNGILRLTGALAFELRGGEVLERREWYLMVANHRSWVDILVLQAAFNRRIPFLKFFIKDQLKWVPLLGLAWWALDMPFMKRHSTAYLERHPEARGRDLEATRRACLKFRRIPTTVINFVEGTRFTEAKREAAGAPYRHLLPPRAGGVAFVLSVMGDTLHSLLDVTIVYGGRTPTLWDLCCGRLKHALLDVRRRAIEPWMTTGDYGADAEFRARFQSMLTTMWAEKDARYALLQAELTPRSG
jgi:1-acyl-sn-glycerol-3-phosphate acyltransferase